MPSVSLRIRGEGHVRRRFELRDALDAVHGHLLGPVLIGSISAI